MHITYICTQTLIISHSTQGYTYIPKIHIPNFGHLFPRSFTHSCPDHITEDEAVDGEDDVTVISYVLIERAVKEFLGPPSFSHGFQL